MALLSSFVIFFQIFLAAPECCPLPRWFSNKFYDVDSSFSSFATKLPTNVHLLPLYQCDSSMFDLDGRHFKSAYGKDYIDHLISASESVMASLNADLDDRHAVGVNRVTAVEGQVVLLHRDQVRSEHRINVVVARAAELADTQTNER